MSIEPKTKYVTFSKTITLGDLVQVLVVLGAAFVFYGRFVTVENNVIHNTADIVENKRVLTEHEKDISGLKVSVAQIGSSKRLLPKPITETE